MYYFLSSALKRIFGKCHPWHTFAMEFQLNFQYQNKSIFNSTKGWHQDIKPGRVVSIVEETPSVNSMLGNINIKRKYCFYQVF